MTTTTNVSQVKLNIMTQQQYSQATINPNELYMVTDASPLEPTRNVGQIITSIIPLTDAGLHLLDGGLINGDGIYSDFVDYVGNLYTNATKYANVQIVGDLSTTGNVLSGFSNSNYAIVPAGFSPDSNTWEMVFKFTYVTAAQNQVVVDVNDGTLLTRPISIFTKASTNTLAYCLSSVVSTDTAIYDILADSNGSNTLTSGTTYYVKLEFTGSAYNGYISTDGETWTLDITTTSSTPIAGGYKPYIGWWQGGGAFMTGTIDLNESYIDIDGERWWDGTMPHLFINEAQWQYSTILYGECGKFVYTPASGNDSATVRLPKIEGITQGTYNIQTLGDLVEAGLPNITGSTGQTTHNAGNPATGSFEWNSSTTGYGAAANAAWAIANLSFNASNSSSIYGNSSTVQPQTIKILYYIVLATNTKTEIEVDIDEITTDLNAKADNDLSNVTIAQSSAVQTALDTKVNAADIWYNSTNKTLYIGVAQS